MIGCNEKQSSIYGDILKHSYIIKPNWVKANIINVDLCLQFFLSSAMFSNGGWTQFD